MTKKMRAVSSAVLFLADACFEVGRVVLGRPWPGIAAGLSNLVSLSLAATWATAAVFQLSRQRRPRYDEVTQLLCIGATLLMVLHAAVTRVLGSYVGLGNLVLVLLQIVLLRHGFDARQPRPRAQTT
jgi:hypothetical protein